MKQYRNTCEQHKNKEIKYMCYHKDCKMKSRLLCDLCLLELNQIECEKNSKIITVSQFLESLDYQLKKQPENQHEKLAKIWNFAIQCEKTNFKNIQKQVKQNFIGKYILQQKIERFDFMRTSELLKDVLEDENFSEDLTRENQVVGFKFKLFDEFDDIAHKLEKIKNLLFFSCSINAEKSTRLSEKASKKQQTKVENNYQQQILLQEQGITENNINKSIIIISDNDDKEAKKIAIKLKKINEISLTNETIQSVRIINQNQLIVQTNTKLLLAKLSINFDQPQNFDVITLFLPDDQILNFKIFDQKDNELIVQTKEGKLYLINIETKESRYLIEAPPKLYFYLSTQKSLYVFQPETNQLKKFILKPEGCIFDKQIQIFSLSSLIAIQKGEQKLSLVFQNGIYKLYNFEDLQFHSMNDIKLQLKATDIRKTDNYNIFVNKNQIYLRNSQNKIIENLKFDQRIKQFTHQMIGDSTVLINIILQNGDVHFQESNLQQIKKNNKQIVKNINNYNFNQSNDEKQIKFFSTIFHENQKKEVHLLLGSSTGSVFIYRISK